MNFFPLVQLMRPKQWTKNVFVLAPLIFSFRLTDEKSLGDALVAFLVFGLCASMLYIINDLRDRQADREHSKKRQRPLASGALTPAQALALLAGVFVCIAALLIWAEFNVPFFVALGLYVMSSIAYSFGLKQVALLELFIVASGYVLRLLAGCAAIHEAPSPWILAATGTVSLLIVAGKRRAEIAENNDPNRRRRSLEGYNLVFLDNMITMLAASTIVTYLLFTTSDYAINRYATPYFVATSVFVLYGVLRYMQLVKVMTGADDPTTLVLSDRSLRYAIFGWLITCIGMIYGPHING